MTIPSYSAMTTLELANSIKANLDRYLELEREYARLYHLPLPGDCSEKGQIGVSVTPASAGESSLAASTLPTILAIRAVAQLNAMLDPTATELAEILSNINRN